MVMLPAAKVATVDQKTSPLRLDDRLQAEDGQAEQVHQEGDLHEGGVALEGLRAIQCHVDESKSSILKSWVESDCLTTWGVFAETETRDRREVNWKRRRTASLDNHCH